MLQERPWPAYLGGPARAPAAAESVAAEPQLVWRTQVARGITGGPAVTEDVIAVATADRRVVLLDRATGAELWSHRLDLPLGAGPLVRDDRVFVAEQVEGGRVYALSLRDGREVWRAEAGPVVASLALRGNAVYVATLGGLVGRLSADSGRWAWRARLSGGVRAAPVPTPQGVIVATTADSLVLLDSARGTVSAKLGTPGAVLAAPALADSLLVLGTMAGRVLAVNPATLAPRWMIELDGPVVGSVAVADGRAWALTGGGQLCVVGLAGPPAVRRQPLGVVTRAGPQPTADAVLVSAVNGELVLTDTLGNRRWSARLEPPLAEPAVVAGRTIFAASGRGEVVAYR